MDVTTIQRYIHTSPRKLRLVADMVRNMEPNMALDVLRLTPKSAAKDLIKAIQTVLANGRQAGMDTKKTNFKKIEINESVKMRRFRAGTRGRVKPYKRRMSHIRITLTDDVESLVTRVKSLESSEKVKDSNEKKGEKISS